MSEELSHEAVARRAVTHLRAGTCGTAALAAICKAPAAFLDDALAPLVDGGKLMRINAFRNGAAEFDYRYSATWVPIDGDFDLCKGGGHAPQAAISAVAPATPSRLAPAAPPPAAPAYVHRPTTREELVAQGHRGAASKHDRAALDRALTQSPQSLGWAVAPADPQSDPAPSPEKTMSAKTPKRQPTKGTSARFQICALLMAKGDLSREDLLADVTADKQAIYNAFHTAKKDGHIVCHADGKWHITAAGREWTGGGANLGNHKAASSSPREVKRSRRQPREKSAGLPKHEKQRLGVVDVRADGSPKKPPPRAITVAASALNTIQVVEERSFRCAVFSDGGFHLSKGGQSIDLTHAEHAEMLRYLERMDEQQA